MRLSTPVMASVLLSAVALAQQPVADPLVKSGVTKQIGAHTYVIPDGDVPLVPNVGIVVGQQQVLVIDPGLGRRNGETVLREVERVAPGRKTIWLAATHYHAEHSTGWSGFPATARFMIFYDQKNEFAELLMPQIAAFSKRSAMTAELLRDAGPPTSSELWAPKARGQLGGGVNVHFLAVGPTHTRGDTAMFVEGDGVLFAGDVVMNQSFLAATPVTSMKAWLAAFDTLEALRPKTIVPSHGAVGDASLIEANRAVMLAVQARARELKAQGRSADETAALVQKEMQAQHPGWPRANGLIAAARSAWSEAP
jgi:glyoxylase-like metal-dependent hydrolase (beta-lactamase superfamily II)